MNNAIKIKDNIYWIGVNDRRTHIFENYWPLPKGVAYNSYVIADEKIPSNAAGWMIIWIVCKLCSKAGRLII